MYRKYTYVGLDGAVEDDIEMVVDNDDLAREPSRVRGPSGDALHVQRVHGAAVTRLERYRVVGLEKLRGRPHYIARAMMGLGRGRSLRRHERCRVRVGHKRLGVGIHGAFVHGLRPSLRRTVVRWWLKLAINCDQTCADAL